MDLPEMLLLGGLLLLMTIMCGYYLKSRRRIVKLLFGSLSGVALLFPAQLILNGCGVPFAMNLFTVSVSAVLGIPGVALLTAAALL